MKTNIKLDSYLENKNEFEHLIKSNYLKIQERRLRDSNPLYPLKVNFFLDSFNYEISFLNDKIDNIYGYYLNKKLFSFYLLLSDTSAKKSVREKYGNPIITSSVGIENSVMIGESVFWEHKDFTIIFRKTYSFPKKYPFMLVITTIPFEDLLIFE